MEKWLQQVPSIDLRTLSPLALAYVGDAVFELYVRMQLVAAGGRVQTLHKSVVEYVRADAQSEILSQWQPLLTEEEAAVVRRGRNAKSTVPRSTDMVSYRQSTGFEALIGYLFLAGQEERLLYLLGQVKPTKKGDV